MLVKEALTFRPCQASDLIFIARLSGETFAEYSTKAVSHTLDMVGRYTTWVAVRGSDAVGFVAVNKESNGVAVLHAIAGFGVFSMSTMQSRHWPAMDSPG